MQKALPLKVATYRITLAAISLALLFAGCGGAGPESQGEKTRASESSASEETTSYAQCSSEWRTLEPGLEVRNAGCDKKSPEPQITAVRIDSGQWNLSAEIKRDGEAREFAEGDAPVFALNANFFDENRAPLGLVYNGRQLQPPHPVSWQPLLILDKKGDAQMVPFKRWVKLRGEAVMALQCGPRLLTAGVKNRVKQGEPSRRSGVCLRKNEIIFFATSGDQYLDVHQVADLAARPVGVNGLGCSEAMLFDGGPSTQLFLQAGGEKIDIRGDRVPVFVVARRADESRTMKVGPGAGVGGPE